MAEESRFLRTLGTAQMPGTLGPSRTPAPLGIGPSIILMGDPVPAKVTQQRTGTLVLYIAPTPPAPQKKDGVEYRWSFDTNEGRVQYETALAKHLKDKGVISGDTDYQLLTATADFANLGSDTHANLVLIVHSFADQPAIATNLGTAAAGIKPDFIKADKFAALFAPFGYDSITILG
jgi:hypothetical protein